MPTPLNKSLYLAIHLTLIPHNIIREIFNGENRYRKPDGNGNVELQWSLIGNATESLAAAVTAAAAADLTVLAVGGSDQTTNEGCDRAELDLTGRQLELVQKVHAVAKKLVVVLIGEPAA